MMKKYFLIGGATGLIIALAGFPLTAKAGFQFTAPVGQIEDTGLPVPPISGGLLPSIPDIRIDNNAAAPVAAEPVTPVESAPTPLAMPSATVPRMPQTGISSLALQQPLPAPVAPTAPVATPKHGDGYAMAVGFGRDLPLVTALRQVVPVEYTYVMDDSVPMGQNVSWEGGRPWNQVLQDMLAPLGLTAQVRGNQVAILSGMAVQKAATSDAIPTGVMATADDIPSLPPLPVATPIAYAGSAVHQTMPAPAPASPASMVVPQVSRGSWIAHRGDSLRSVLEEWAGQAGAELFWSSDYDYPLAGAVNISGSFEEAVETLLKGFEQARPKPIARLHPNLPHGPAVLVVETRQTLD